MSYAPSYLQLSRHSIWYFRIAIPASVRALFGCAEVRRSLQTRCKREALIRGRDLLRQVQTQLTDAFQGRLPDKTKIGLDAATPIEAGSWEKWIMQDAPKVDAGQGSEPASKPHVGPRLSEVMEEYGLRQLQEGVAHKTVRNKESVVKLLVDQAGDLPISHVTRKDAQGFRAFALKLPPRLGQLAQKPLEKAMEEATETIHVGTYNHYIKNLTTVFKYAMQEGYCQTNPFDGLQIRQRRKPSASRARFTEDDLRVVFNPATYEDKATGRPYRYWLPLMGLFTGARLNELCQLYLDDVVTVDGIDCIHIRADKADQRLKTPGSERLIPIHTALKERGFMGYVEALRARGESRLFPEIGCHKTHGYSAIPSKWFAKYRKGLGFTDEDVRKDFHSFRHTVADHLKQEGMVEGRVAALLGHSSGGITFSRYGKDFDPASMVPVVESLVFLLEGQRD